MLRHVSVPAKGYQSLPRGTSPCQGAQVPTKGSYSSPERDAGSQQRVMRTALNLEIFDIILHIFAVQSVNHVLMILAPGVIQLTLLNVTALDRVIRDLARDPRYSSILRMRTGVDPRSSGGSSPTVTQLLEKDPSNQGLPAQASSSQAGVSPAGQYPVDNIDFLYSSGSHIPSN